MTFESKKKELAKIADKLESDKTTLEESATLFEAGIALSKECLAMLSTEQGKIVIVTDGKEETLTDLD